MIKRISLMAVLVALAIGSTAAAQQRGRGGFGGMQASSAGLLRISEVRDELKITEDQQKQIQEAVASLRENREGSNREDFRNLSQEERQKRFAEMRERAEAANKEIDEKLSKILDESQQKRLQELRLQREGVSAFSRQEVADKLGLSDEQQQKIRQIQQDARQGFGDFRNLSEDERREAFTKMREQREKANTDILAVLNDEQKAKWNEMKGAEFNFPQGRGFGGRRPNN